MARPICIDGKMPPAPPRPKTVIWSPHQAGFTPCPRCGQPKPLARVGECTGCEHHDRAETARIARERAVAAYGEGRC